MKCAGAVGAMAAGGVAWRAYDQGVFSVGAGPAYEQWINWRTEDPDDLQNLVRAAILAANPHDSQPWKFRVTPDQIDVYADTSRNLGSVDPFRREMYLGLGCALENLLLTAEAGSYACRLSLMPDDDATHVATVGLSKGDSRPSALYHAIPLRHTNRGPYDRARIVDIGSLNALRDLNEDDDIAVFWFTTDADRSRIGDLTVKATEVIIADSEQDADSCRWNRSSWQEVQEHKDGITVDTSGLPGYMIILSKILPAQSHEQNDKYWLSSTRDNQVATAGAYGIIAARDSHDNVMRLKGGRLYQRMSLSATVDGMATQPMNQMLERAERESVLGIEPSFGNALADLTGKDWQALILFRIGYPSINAGRSPRRDLKDVLI